MTMRRERDIGPPAYPLALIIPTTGKLLAYNTNYSHKAGYCFVKVIN
jgi:hypothetical protein